MKRAKTLIDGKQPKAWMDYMFDHTMIIAEDDPEVEAFKQMDQAGVAQVRVIPCLLYTSPSPRDRQKSRMPSSA